MLVIDMLGSEPSERIVAVSEASSVPSSVLFSLSGFSIKSYNATLNAYEPSETPESKVDLNSHLVAKASPEQELNFVSAPLTSKIT